eukprot:Colp12_sorted_trinity150504_noHs@3265
MSNFLSSILPAPVRQTYRRDSDDGEAEIKTQTRAKKGPPPYGQRTNWVPRTQEDYGGGGAFPEVHVAQFPLDMGRKRKAAGATLPVTLDAEGNVQYDLVLRQGSNKDRVIHKSLNQILSKDVQYNDPKLAKPSDEEIEETTERTRQALEKIVNGKIAVAKTTGNLPTLADAQIIRYTPAQQGENFNSGAQQRIIRMVEAPVDPLDPPKHKHKKVPRAPNDDLTPVLHSPPRKVTVQEQQAFKIPPCISNWKNPRGYTIALDKRLASDGRGLEDKPVNDKFAKLAEALHAARETARESVRIRQDIAKRKAQLEKEDQERQLREKANQARMERAGIQMEKPSRELGEEAVERDRLREDRKYERERAKRLEKLHPDAKVRKERERDVSEQIALGMPMKGSSDNLYDQRLFNQTRGMDSGFGDDETYNTYDKPLFNTTAQSIYRPRKGIEDTYGDDVDKLMKKFHTDKEFEGASAQAQSEGPVQFEKEDEDDDLFGGFFSEVKKGGNALDKIGKGQMHAGSTGGQSARDRGERVRDRQMAFESDDDRGSKRHRH